MKNFFNLLGFNKLINLLGFNKLINLLGFNKLINLLGFNKLINLLGFNKLSNKKKMLISGSAMALDFLVTILVSSLMYHTYVWWAILVIIVGTSLALGIDNKFFDKYKRLYCKEFSKAYYQKNKNDIYVAKELSGIRVLSRIKYIDNLIHMVVMSVLYLIWGILGILSSPMVGYAVGAYLSASVLHMFLGDTINFYVEAITRVVEEKNLEYDNSHLFTISRIAVDEELIKKRMTPTNPFSYVPLASKGMKVSKEDWVELREFLKGYNQSDCVGKVVGPKISRIKDKKDDN